MNSTFIEDTQTYDYIVVGSGAGGGPSAANLAKAGCCYSVLLLEAGGDPLQTDDGKPMERYTYSVPAFHPHSTEDDDLRWSFFVRHYADENKQRRDGKYPAEHNGILYPRARTLGGCTTHNAMITVYPHNSDWDKIAEITQDPSWQSDNMRKYFERLEQCKYIERPQCMEDTTSRHGFDGWLATSLADPKLAVRDRQLLGTIVKAVLTTLQDKIPNFFERLQYLSSQLSNSFLSILKGETALKDIIDRAIAPNDWRVVHSRPEVEGVKFVRELTDQSDLFIKTEMLPGGEIDREDEVKQFIKDEAWGHHACGTCNNWTTRSQNGGFRQQFPRIWNAKFARSRCFGISFYSWLFHCYPNLHD